MSGTHLTIESGLPASSVDIFIQEQEQNSCPPIRWPRWNNVFGFHLLFSGNFEFSFRSFTFLYIFILSFSLYNLEISKIIFEPCFPEHIQTNLLTSFNYLLALNMVSSPYGLNESLNFQIFHKNFPHIFYIFNLYKTYPTSYKIHYTFIFVFIWNLK